MSQSLSSVVLHIVFSTKERFPFLSDEDVRRQVHAFLGEIAKNLNCPPILIGGVSYQDEFRAFLESEGSAYVPSHRIPLAFGTTSCASKNRDESAEGMGFGPSRFKVETILLVYNGTLDHPNHSLLAVATYSEVLLDIQNAG